MPNRCHFEHKQSFSGSSASTIASYGLLSNGKRVRAVTLRNDELSARIIEYGARMTSLRYKGTELTLGLNRIKEYEHDTACLGAIIGRNANRIADARCRIDGVDYDLDHNDGRNNNHSGPHGFERQLWNIDENDLDDTHATLRLVSPDMSQGFPGTMNFAATYALHANELSIEFHAQSDRTTVCNPTTHIYWNLNGDGSTALDHTLMIPSGTYLPTNRVFIPAAPCSVEGTAFDFRTPRRLCDAMDIREPVASHRIPEALSKLIDPQLRNARGYNHAFAFPHGGEASQRFDLVTMATLTGGKGSIRMELSSDAPALLMYSSGFLSEPFRPAEGIALEPGFLPNAINEPNMAKGAKPILTANASFSMHVRYRFFRTGTD